MNVSRRNACAAVGWALAAAVVLCLSILPNISQYWAFNRSQVADGDIWRLATAAWTHVSVAHAVLNLVGLTILAVVFERSRCLDVLWLIAWGAGVYWVEYALLSHAWARGLSGPVHAYAVYLAMTNAMRARHRALSVVLLAALVLKLTLEACAAGSPSQALIGAPVLTSHHLIGAVLGAVTAAAVCLVQRTLGRLYARG